jgi:CHRD domain
MKRLSVLVLGLSVLAVGCSESSSPSGPSPGGTSTTTTFTVPLSPANEVPAITNADASGSGTAVIALTVTKDAAGTITSAIANIQISVTGFPTGTTFTDAHIHNGGPGSNAGVFVSAGLASGELVLTNGSGSIAKNGISVPSDRAAAILGNPAGHYFNVHTLLNPNGSIRGQLAGGGATVNSSDPVPY